MAAMTHGGTAAYLGREGVPGVVRSAVDAARRLGFEYSCLPEQGELLRLLARGAGPGVIGETGTGCGVGLAWLASGADVRARLVSAEVDPDRAAAATGALAARPNVEIRVGDGLARIADAAPFDLLVLDGGPGSGKSGEEPLDPARWLRPGGLLVIDDFTPNASWPPSVGGEIDLARQHWLEHPLLRAAELRLTPVAATIVATFLPVGSQTFPPSGSQ
jgi:predicted O-methyltransferase YrrM